MQEWYLEWEESLFREVSSVLIEWSICTAEIVVNGCK